MPVSTPLSASAIRSILHQIHIWPRRLALVTGTVRATIPLLRGVWGAALHDLDRVAYEDVFAPTGPDTVPGYLLRPAPPDPHIQPAVDWLLFGSACKFDQVLCRAWDVAAGRGIGRNRQPFFIRRMLGLDPQEHPSDVSRLWALGQCTWPADAHTPCRLQFSAPLRLLRQGNLITQPTLTDLVVAAHRRVRTFLLPTAVPEWNACQIALLDEARVRPSSWRGQRLDLQRYSGRQHAEVEMRGICGVLDLPEGPGELWPLLAAASWLHVGKGTVFGLGQMHVMPWRC